MANLLRLRQHRPVEKSLNGRLLRLAISLVALVLISSVSTPSLAQSDQRARELFLEGEDDYAAGRYEEAAGKFEEAYRLSKRAGLLFNLGNTYERMGEFQKAVEALQKYLDSPNPQRVRETKQRIKLLRKRAEDKRKREDELKKLRDQGKGGGTTDPDPDPDPDPDITEPTKTPSRMPSYLLIGGGGAAIAAGVVLALGASSAGSDAEKQCVQGSGGLFCPSSADSDLDRERNLSIAADLSFLVGIGAVTAGVILWVTAEQPEEAFEEDDGTMVFGPTLVPGGGGVGVTGRF